MASDTIRVLMSSTSYPASLSDWKGLFIRHLADALARRADLQLSLWAPPGDSHPALQRVSSDSESRFLTCLMDDGGIAHLIRSRNPRALTAIFGLLRGLRQAYRRSDVDLYHVNWLQNALPLPDDGRPALVTALGTDMQLLRLPLVRTLLRRVFSRRPTAICPNAQWMVEPLQAAFGDVAQVQAVPFGIDPQWFASTRQPDPQHPKWLTVSRLTRAKLGPLFEWGEPLFRGQPRELHLFGPMQEQISLPDWVHYHGPATPQQLCQTWFPQAHGLLTLSEHAEGLPQVILEAMAATLPVVASRMPAHASMVEHGRAGWLCDSPADLAQALQQLEQPDCNRQHGELSRQRCLTEIGTWDDCAQRYQSLYRQLLARMT